MLAYKQLTLNKPDIAPCMACFGALAVAWSAVVCGHVRISAGHTLGAIFAGKPAAACASFPRYPMDGRRTRPNATKAPTRPPMNTYRAQHEKFIKLIAGTTAEKLVETLSGLEHSLPPGIEEEGAVLVPLEANFQLPNVFLNTRRINRVEKLFAGHGRSVGQSRAAEQVVAWLDEIQFECKEAHGADHEEQAQALNAILEDRMGR